MASEKTLALRTEFPKEPCKYAPGREPEVIGNHAPFHYLDWNRQARRHGHPVHGSWQKWLEMLRIKRGLL